MKKPYLWDPYSDQPYQLKDRTFKKKGRKKELFSLLYTYLSSLILLPLFIMLQVFVKPRKIGTKQFFGMSVNLDRFPKESVKLIKELGVDTVLIRLPLWEMERLEAYVAFVQQFSEQKVILNIMQDREHVEDLEFLKTDLHTIFEALHKDVSLFQIGTTINRAKWGFFSVGEYLKFYRVAYLLKKQHFPKIALMGPSVIDFEYHFDIHALFNFVKLRFDALSALLYVDRRGAPENTQMGFDLLKKITLLDTLAFFSPKSKRAIYITETNWPISQTAPYAPTSEHECVSEDLYTEYMLRYCLLAFASQRVDALYWHQLIAPGYGLIDSRDGLKKREAFEAFKVMLQQLQSMEFVHFSQHKRQYILIVKNSLQSVSVLWSLQPTTRHFSKIVHYYDHLGREDHAQHVELDTKPIYITENIHDL